MSKSRLPSRERVRRGLAAAAVGLMMMLPAAVAADEFVGSFEGDGLYLELELDDGVYTGAIELGEQIFLCQARRAGGGLAGTFESDAGSFPFELRAADGGLVLTSGGAAYELRKLGEEDPAAAAANPLAGGGAVANPLAEESSGGKRVAAPAGLAGRYEGSIQGTPATMTLEERGGRLTGRIDASGYPYDLEGTATGTRARGRGSDPQSGGTFEFEANLSGDRLDFSLITRDPFSGQEQRMPIAFRRAGSGGPGGGETTGPGGSGVTRGVPPGPRDPALVGVWRHSESMSGGGSSMVVENYLQINGDGTWALGGGRAVGGGAGWGGDTGTGGVEESGYWKSENRIVYVQSPGSGQWQPYARYYVEGGKLMFTFGDNSRQILYRVR